MTNQTIQSAQVQTIDQNIIDQKAAETTSAPLQLTLESNCATSVQKLFSAFTDPNLMCQIFPWMHEIAITEMDEQFGGVGASRRCYFGNGLLLEETIVGWWPPSGYAYQVDDRNHPFGMRGHVGTLWFEPTEDSSLVVWKQYFDHSNPAAMREKMLESMTVALNNLKTCTWQRPI